MKLVNLCWGDEQIKFNWPEIKVHRWLDPLTRWVVWGSPLFYYPMRYPSFFGILLVSLQWIQLVELICRPWTTFQISSWLLDSRYLHCQNIPTFHVIPLKLPGGNYSRSVNELNKRTIHYDVQMILQLNTLELEKILRHLVGCDSQWRNDDHGGVWVQIPSGARMFRVSSRFNWNVISFNTCFYHSSGKVCRHLR